MTRKTKALSGASQDAYFRPVLKTFSDIPEPSRERIVHQLRREIAQLRVRPGARDAAVAAVQEGAAPPASPETPKIESNTGHHPEPGAVEPAAAPRFDPFAVNVMVVLRTKGKAAAIAALNAIGTADDLKLLAREQQLGIGEELTTTADLSAAIVTAAERRLANRRAAAGSH